MFRKSQKVQQTTEPGHEVVAKKSRFQIMKLEERIAPIHRGRCHGGPKGGGPHCY